MNSIRNYTLNNTDCIPERDIENDFSEWFEDAISEADWADNFSMHGLDTPPLSVMGDFTDHSGRTLLDELYRKNKVLERAWRDTEQKYQNLQVENQKLNVQLSNEKYRASKYQKKLQYIQDNQEIFAHLKQAYLNMKYNESVGRSMIEIQERSCQTEYELPSDQTPPNTKAKTNLINQFISIGTSEMVTVKRADITKLQQTVHTLKNMIDAREKSWSNSSTREGQYKANISELRGRLQFMTNLLATRYSDVFRSPENMEMIEKENSFLKKIIVKMDRHYKELERTYRTGRRQPILNQQEKSMVQQLIQRYRRTLEQKATRTLSCETRDHSPVEIARNPKDLIDVPGDMEAIGNGEGIVFNIPLPKRPASNRSACCTEIAEKPLSPKKKDIMEQINSIDFAQNIVADY